MAIYLCINLWKIPKLNFRLTKRHCTTDRLGMESLSSAILEFQWIEIRCTVKVINVFDSFEPQGDSKCYWQQDKFHTDF